MVSILESVLNCSALKFVISGLEISSLIPNFSKDLTFPLNLAALTLNSLLRIQFNINLCLKIRTSVVLNLSKVGNVYCKLTSSFLRIST